ncbi:Gfo/Idh/MocA family protein [Endozoicomonas montiporae]|uniref:Gfo/Idh/MocA family protein n=1 Tax=Endozoicomonas montiporae TaxID=1027273 RepID=UPI0022A8EF52|nr:Gfo/Idh/MocA family oxidoreductase [Endozoicomonas montiporae]
MRQRPFKSGSVGYGWWGREAYGPAIQKDGRAEIVAVCARSKATLDKAREDIGAHLSLYEDFTKLLAQESLDALFIAVPDELHESYLRQAIETGVAIFYEPPISNQPERIPAMLDVLQNASQLLHGDTELVYTPVFQQTSDLINDNLIGDIRHISLELNSNWGPIPDCELSLINNIAPWYFDVISRVSGKLPKRVMVLEDSDYISSLSQNQSLAVLDFGTFSATLRANIAAAVASDETTLTVHGTEGDLVASYFTGNLKWRTRANPEWSQKQVDPILPVAGWPGIHESVIAFFNALQQGERTLNNPWRMAQMCAAGAAAETSRLNRDWIDVQYPAESAAP